MKKALLAVTLVLSIGLLYAQPKSVFVGVKGGLNLASLNIQNGVDYNEMPSGYAGGLIHAHFTDHFALQHELFFSGQGGKQGSDHIRLLYLNMPLLAQYMFGEGFRLETGPQLGVLLAARQKTGNNEFKIRDDLKPLDFSWVMGAGYVFPNTGFGLDARYNLGISNINDGAQAIENRVFSVGAFYQLQCKHPMKHKH